MEKRRYETTFIINGGLEEFFVQQLTKEVLNLIRNNGGDIRAWEQMGRRRLAYPIDKKVNGYYVYVYYDAPPTLPGILERFFRLEENILRFLTVKLDKRGIEYREKWIAEKGLKAPTESDYKMEAIEAAISSEEEIALTPEITDELGAETPYESFDEIFEAYENPLHSSPKKESLEAENPESETVSDEQKQDNEAEERE